MRRPRTPLGQALPAVRTPPPGRASRALARRLRAVESRNVTYLSDRWPVFWEEARGANVRDADGNVYLDLTAAFGVALPGHAREEIREALAGQAARLVHGMGDVHPPSVKVRFLERLAAVVGGVAAEAGAADPSGPPAQDRPQSQAGPGHPLIPDPRALLANSGSEAVEAALKTAHLATGRPGVIAFRGGYHGLTLGALSATARRYFREPFADRLPTGVAWADFPTGHSLHGEGGPAVEAALARVREWLEGGLPDGTPVGAILVEPVQARGGVRIPAPGFGSGLSALARAHDTVLIADEIYTGMGRCGAVLASTRVGLRPDLVCLGKVLGGGMPLSALVGRRAVMDAWPDSPGEALHTSTFLGHPLGCAAGLAVLEMVERGLPGCARELGDRLLARLEEALAGVPGVADVRGMGLLLGIELAPGKGVAAAEALLREGILVLPAGDRGEVVELSPPAVLTEEQERVAVEVLARTLASLAREEDGA